MAEAIKPQFELSCRCPPRGTEPRSGLSSGSGQLSSSPRSKIVVVEYSETELATEVREHLGFSMLRSRDLEELEAWQARTGP